MLGLLCKTTNKWKWKWYGDIKAGENKDEKNSHNTVCWMHLTIKMIIKSSLVLYNLEKHTHANWNFTVTLLKPHKLTVPPILPITCGTTSRIAITSLPNFQMATTLSFIFLTFSTCMKTTITSSQSSMSRWSPFMVR